MNCADYPLTPPRDRQVLAVVAAMLLAARAGGNRHPRPIEIAT